MSGYIVGGISVAITVAVAVIFYLLQRRTKDPCWAIYSNNILRGHESQVDGLEVLYLGQNVETVTVSRIVFWNRGKRNILGRPAEQNGDISEPVRIVALGGNLLNVSIIQTTREAIQFSVTEIIDNKFSVLAFRHLDHGDGAVLQVIHTGTSSSNLDIEGNIIEANRIRRRELARPDLSSRLFRFVRKYWDLDLAIRADAIYRPIALGLILMPFGIFLMLDSMASQPIRIVDKAAFQLSVWVIVAIILLAGFVWIQNMSQKIPRLLGAFAQDDLQS